MKCHLVPVVLWYAMTFNEQLQVIFRGYAYLSRIYPESFSWISGDTYCTMRQDFGGIWHYYENPRSQIDGLAAKLAELEALKPIGQQRG